MSARAAARLETLGFRQVFRYTPGKADWFASGGPRAGESAASSRVDDLAHEDVPRCRLDEPATDALERARRSGSDLSVAVDDRGVVLGLLQAPAGGPLEGRVEAVMAAGPSTIRPHLTPDEAREYLPDKPRRPDDHVLVTTSDGRLVGLLYRRDLGRARASRAGGRQAA